MVPLLLAVVVAAAPETAPKLASPGLFGLNLDEKATTYYSEQFAQQLALRGLQVITPREIATLIGLERQKQLMGCSDDQSSCLAELSNALGADGTVTGTLGRFGTAYQIDLKILSSRNASALAVHSSRVEGEVALLEELKQAARVMAPKVFEKLGRTAPKIEEPAPPAAVVQAPSRPGPGVLPVVLGSAGVIAAGVGTVFLLQAGQASGQIRSGLQDGVAFELAHAKELAQRGALQQTVGLIGVGVGAAAVAAAVVFGIRNMTSSAPQVSVWPLPSGGGVAVTGSLP
jgi:hypothetical protein